VGCAADLDNDGFITVTDILLLLGEFGCSTNCSFDLDADGIIGVSDILAILAVFGTEC
jgi:Ca2+-binding EF-hand superfamily protein